jgi:hypothetical protein
MTAWAGKRAILRGAKRQIAATRIQKTWKSFLVDLNSRVEREEAILNQITNPLETRSENCSPEPIKAVQKPPVFFGDLVTVKDDNNVIFAESVEEFDGCEKSSTNFTMIVATWLDHMGTNESFFGGVVKKWVDSPSSSNWSSYFTEILQLLKNGEVVILWGHTGGMKKLFPMNQGKITDLQNMWKLHLAEKKLDALLNLQEEISAKKNQRIVMLNSSAKEFNPNEACVAPPVPAGLLKMAAVSGEARLRLHSQSCKDEEDDIEERFMRLLSLQQPTCIVRQL